MPIRSENLHGNVPDNSGAALLLIDVINDFEFEGGEKLLPLRSKTQTLRLLFNYTRSVVESPPSAQSHSDWHRGQQLRAIHRQRRLHARLPTVHSIRLRCVD